MQNVFTRWSFALRIKLGLPVDEPHAIPTFQLTDENSLRPLYSEIWYLARKKVLDKHNISIGVTLLASQVKRRPSRLTRVTRTFVLVLGLLFFSFLIVVRSFRVVYFVFILACLCAWVGIRFGAWVLVFLFICISCHSFCLCVFCWPFLFYGLTHLALTCNTFHAIFSILFWLKRHYCIMIINIFNIIISIIFAIAIIISVVVAAVGMIMTMIILIIIMIIITIIM